MPIFWQSHQIRLYLQHCLVPELYLKMYIRYYLAICKKTLTQKTKTLNNLVNSFSLISRAIWRWDGRATALLSCSPVILSKCVLPYEHQTTDSPLASELQPKRREHLCESIPLWGYLNGKHSQYFLRRCAEPVNGHLRELRNVCFIGFVSNKTGLLLVKKEMDLNTRLLELSATGH